MKEKKKSIFNQNQYDVDSIITFMDNFEIREGTITGLTTVYDYKSSTSKVVYEVINRCGSFLVKENDIIRSV